jgi:hypothetical protein
VIAVTEAETTATEAETATDRTEDVVAVVDAHLSAMNAVNAVISLEIVAIDVAQDVTVSIVIVTVAADDMAVIVIVVTEVVIGELGLLYLWPHVCLLYALYLQKYKANLNMFI